MVFLLVPAAFIRGRRLFKGGVYSNNYGFANRINKSSAQVWYENAAGCHCTESWDAARARMREGMPMVSSRCKLRRDLREGWHEEKRGARTSCVFTPHLRAALFMLFAIRFTFCCEAVYLIKPDQNISAQLGLPVFELLKEFFGDNSSVKPEILRPTYWTVPENSGLQIKNPVITEQKCLGKYFEWKLFTTCLTLVWRQQKIVVTNENRTHTFGFLGRRSTHWAIESTGIGGQFIWSARNIFASGFLRI